MIEYKYIFSYNAIRFFKPVVPELLSSFLEADKTSLLIGNSTVEASNRTKFNFYSKHNLIYDMFISLLCMHANFLHTYINLMHIKYTHIFVCSLHMYISLFPCIEIPKSRLTVHILQLIAHLHKFVAQVLNFTAHTKIVLVLYYQFK